MIEFVVALLVKRSSENRVSPDVFDNKYNRVSKFIGKNSTRTERVSNQAAEVKYDIRINDTPYKRFLNTQMKRALFNQCFDQGEGLKHLDNEKEIDFAFQKKKPSISNKIDILSAILFPAIYVLFNIVYWCSLM